MSKAVLVVGEESDIRPLSEREQMKLAELERRIVQDFGAFYRVGRALAEINELRLYRNEKGRTFAQYCRELWDMCGSRAYQLIDAAEIYDQLQLCSGELSTNCGQTEGEVIEVMPINEAQVRPLVRVKDNPALLKAVWKTAVERGKGKVTASAVNKTVKDYIGEEVEKKERKAREKAKSAGMSEELTAALGAVASIVDTERHGYNKEVRQAIGEYLTSMRQVVTGDECEDDSCTSGHQNANKLEKAGFNLFRMEETAMVIKVRAGGGWPKHSGPYPTKTAMRAAFAELMQDSNNLAG